MKQDTLGGFLAAVGIAVLVLASGMLYGQVDTAWTRVLPEDLAALAVDSAGNVYVAGGYDDLVTVKFRPDGTQEWLARYDGPMQGYDYATAVAVDRRGNVYVTGVCEVDTSTDNSDFATVKYNAAGVRQWVARYDGPVHDYDEAYAIAVDARGNVYVTGAATRSRTAMDYDYATVKYDSSGNECWAKRYDGPVAEAEDEPYAIAVDGQGNVYVTGSSEGSDWDCDIATIKYDSSGARDWVKRFDSGAEDEDEGYALTLDAAGGSMWQATPGARPTGAASPSSTPRPATRSGPPVTKDPPAATAGPRRSRSTGPATATLPVRRRGPEPDMTTLRPSSIPKAACSGPAAMRRGTTTRATTPQPWPSIPRAVPMLPDTHWTACGAPSACRSSMTRSATASG